MHPPFSSPSRLFRYRLQTADGLTYAVSLEGWCIDSAIAFFLSIYPRYLDADIVRIESGTVWAES